MSKLEKENEALTRRMATVRASLAARKDEFVRKGAGMGTGFVVGALEKNGKLSSLPTIPGVPRIVTLGIVANGIAWFAPKGMIRTIADGAGESLLDVASYKWGKGEDVAGASEIDVGTVEGRRRRIRAEQRQTSDRVRALEDQLRRQISAEMGEQPAEFADYIDVPA